MEPRFAQEASSPRLSSVPTGMAAASSSVCAGLQDPTRACCWRVYVEMSQGWSIVVVRLTTCKATRTQDKGQLQEPVCRCRWLDAPKPRMCRSHNRLQKRIDMLAVASATFDQVSMHECCSNWRPQREHWVDLWVIPTKSTIKAYQSTLSIL